MSLATDHTAKKIVALFRKFSVWLI